MSRVRQVRDSSELAAFLRHKSNHVIAAAAKAIQQAEDGRLAPELSAAFLELFPNAPKRDPGCKALIALVEALATMGEDAPEVYLKGADYVQMEGSFGPPVDVAAPLRGLCVRGLVRMRHPLALPLTVERLVDRETPARIGAVQALQDANGPEAELLLRLKVLAGDKEDDVVGACFAALLLCNPGPSLDFVRRFLGREVRDGLVEAAALALGEAHVDAALPFLIEAWTTHRDPGVRRVILLSIALLRHPEAVDFLLTRLNQDAVGSVPAALDALALFRSDDTVAARVKEIVERRSLGHLVRSA